MSSSEQVYLQVMMARTDGIDEGADLWIGMKRLEYYVNVSTAEYSWCIKRLTCFLSSTRSQ